MENESKRPPTAYQWLLDVNLEAPEIVPRRLAPLLTTELAFAITLAAPPVVRATGISATAVVAMVGTHAAWSVLTARFLGPRVGRWPAAYHFIALGYLVLGVGITCLLPALAGDPRTPLWMLPVLYAAMNGAIQETAPSRIFLLVHVLGPLLTIPAFAGRGGAWSVAGPILTSAVSAATYHFISARVAAWRGLRRERDEALALVRVQEAELERTRLARDLHDSVGASLGFLALHADLLERHATDPGQVRRLASLAREAAREGLGELRGVLEALAPEESTLGGLARSLEDVATRQLAGTGVTLSGAAITGESERLDPAVRLALVRVFQEALRNAVLHGRARRVEWAFLVEGGEVSLEVRDDGRGFDPALVRAGARGLAGMRARATELGGRWELKTSPGAGTTVRISLPIEPALRKSS